MEPLLFILTLTLLLTGTGGEAERFNFARGRVVSLLPGTAGASEVL